MAIRLIAFDLDDTLLDPNRGVAQGDREAIRRAREKGIAILPASGRRFNSMEGTMRLIGHQGYAITLNGAKVATFPGEEPLYERYIEPELCREVIDTAAQSDMYVQTYVGENFEYEQRGYYSELYSRLSGAGGDQVGPLDGFIARGGLPSKKMLFIEEDIDKMDAFQRHMLDRFGDRLMVVRSKAFYLEVTHPEATKGAALVACCERLGVRREEVLAIGDGENDLTMLHWAGIGVAMGNADEEIKRRVEHVTDTNAACGVGKAIERFALSDY